MQSGETKDTTSPALEATTTVCACACVCWGPCSHWSYLRHCRYMLTKWTLPAPPNNSHFLLWLNTTSSLFLVVAPAVTCTLTLFIKSFFYAGPFYFIINYWHIDIDMQYTVWPLSILNMGQHLLFTTCTYVPN